MIVHPIGMMRANAAAGLNFVDDFTGYTVGQTVYDQTPYSSPQGYSYTYIRDNSGTRVARQEGASTTHTYIAETVADSREVYGVTNTTGGSSGAILHIYLYYIDASNYCFATADTVGWVGLKQWLDGSPQSINTDYNTGAPPVAGDKLTISRSGSTVTVKKNETTLITKTLVGAPTGGAPGFYMQVGTPTPYREIREFGVRDL